LKNEPDGNQNYLGGRSITPDSAARPEKTVACSTKLNGPNRRSLNVEVSRS